LCATMSLREEADKAIAQKIPAPIIECSLRHHLASAVPPPGLRDTMANAVSDRGQQAV
jgi:hypothetical protein